jgi:predicted secreted protein
MAKIKSFGVRVFVGGNEIGGLKSVELPEVEVTDIDLTTHNSTGGFREFDGGLKDGGTVTMSGAYDIADDGQAYIRDPDNQGEDCAVVVVFSDGSWSGFDGVIKGYGVSNPLDEDVTFNSSIKVSGEIGYQLAPPYMVVTGTLTDGTDPVVFPVLTYNNISQWRNAPAYPNTNYEISPGDEVGWVLQSRVWTDEVSLETGARWESSSDVATPDLVPPGAWHETTNPHAWKPTSPATGTPVVTRAYVLPD